MKELEQDDFMSLSKMNFDVSEEQSLILEQVDRVCKKSGQSRTSATSKGSATTR